MSLLRLCLGQYRGPRGVKHFLRYAAARAREEAETLSFRVYVTDALRAAGMGRAPGRRWADCLAPADTRSGDEIAADLLAEAGLRWEDNEHGCI